MACNVNKLPLFRTMARRGYSAAANPRPLGQPATVETKVLDNKVVVAAAESQLPICRVSVVFKAGSRYENYDNLGASHMLRVSAGLSTEEHSGFTITRNLQQKGVGLTVSSDREAVAYTMEATTNNQECALGFLKEVIRPIFKPWELSDAVPRIKTHVANVSPQVRAVELLHKAAYNSGLGNSVYIPKFKIGKLSSETLQHYVENNFTAERCAVVGVGVDHNTLDGFAQCLEFKTGSSSSKDEPAAYQGGEARKDTPGNMSYVAIAGEGGALSNEKEVLAFAVLQQAMGVGARVRRGNVNGGFGKVLQSNAQDAAFLFTTLNASYTDSGLFGFLLAADPDTIDRLTKPLVDVLKSGKVSDEDFNRGKNLLKCVVMETYGTDGALLQDMGLQALLNKSVKSAEELESAINSVSLQDVQNAAKKAGSSKLSLGAVGNLGKVPNVSTFA